MGNGVTRRRSFALRLASVGMAGLVIGCSSGDATSPPATDGPSSEPTSAASLDPLAPYPRAEGDLLPVRLAQSVPALSFAPLLIAREMNFYEYQGVEVEYVELQSGATAMQALTGRSIDLTDSASTEVAAAVGQGVELLAIQNTITMTLEVCASRAWTEQQGITPDSSLEERMAAMKGATVGITGPGAVSDRAFRWLVEKYGELDPNTEVTFTQVGGAAAIAGALDAGQIQAFLMSPPNCGKTEGGIVLVPPSDVPEFANYVHEVLFGTKEWIEANKEAATGVATAISMGNNFILQHPEKATEILQGLDPSTEPAVIEASMEQVIIPAIRENGLMDATMWDATNTVLTESGVIPESLDTTEGGFWTNEYIVTERAAVQ